jgi:chitinase
MMCLLFGSRNETCNPFTAASIDASSYTHIVFSFASISADGTLEPWDFESDIKGGQYQQFIDVKKKFPETKAIISVGGWTHNEPGNERLHRFSNSAASPMSRMKFSQSSVAFMRKYGFDG